MFSYTALLIPVLNGIEFIVGKYNLTPDTLVQNFASLGVGIGTIIAKNGISEILKRLKIKIDKKKVMSDIKTGPEDIKSFDTFKKDVELIKEQ